ncbi:MAG: hypothetical protein ACLRWP_09880 [Bilophila wadsworthia]
MALCGLAAAPALAKPRKPKDADWTETFDVIVIGKASLRSWQAVGS